MLTLGQAQKLNIYLIRNRPISLLLSLKKLISTSLQGKVKVGKYVCVNNGIVYPCFTFSYLEFFYFLKCLYKQLI